MRVCRVVNSMWTGGVQRQMRLLLPELRRRGAEVEICVIRSRGEMAEVMERDQGIPVTLVRVERRLQPRSLRRLARFFRERRFDVVHTHMYAANVPGTVAARLARVPAVFCHLHNVDTYHRMTQRVTDRLLMPLRSGVLCVSRAVALDAARALGMPVDRFTVLYNGVHTPDLPRQAEQEALRGELGLPQGAPLVAHVARLHPQKNHAAFLEAFPRVLRAFPEAVLLIAGQGREEGRLRATVSFLGIERQVRFLGLREDISSLLALADVSVLPSYKEGFSNVVLESMACGAVVVCTDTGGAREQIRDGVEGFIVPLGDMGALADRVIECLGDRALRERMAGAGRRRVEEFSVGAAADRTLGLYERALGIPGGLSR